MRQATAESTGAGLGADRQPLTVGDLDQAFKGYKACFVEAGPDNKNWSYITPSSPRKDYLLARPSKFQTA